MSETAAAQLNFGPAWLRESMSSENSGTGCILPISRSSSTPSASVYTAFPSSSGLATAKLAEYRYGREEMLALFSADNSSLPNYQIDLIASAGIFIERPQLPLNLMGAMSEEEQRAWQRGANSDSSLKLYKKDAPGMGRGDRGGRGGGRGAGGPRGGPGNPFYDRHRANDDDGHEVGVGVGRGRGSEEGGRSFGRGRGYERSVSDRGGWFERSSSVNEDGNNTAGNLSPRKGYTRAPFDDWRKPTSGVLQEGDEEGGPTWRGSNTASGRRWNAPHGGGTVPEGRSVPWRNGENGGARDEFGQRRGFHSSSTSKFGRPRHRQDSDSLPEWASEDPGPLESGGGTFDSAGKFQSTAGEKSSEKSNRDVSGEEGGHEDKVASDEDLSKVVDSVVFEDHFEDVEVDVDDLPTDMKRDTLDQREKDRTQQQEVPQNSELGQENEKRSMPHGSVAQKIDEPTPPPEWIYLDPQGNTQGPFGSSDMLDWFNAGYFPQDLMLRRTIDRRFIQLVEMTKICGGNPFLPGVNAPPAIPEVEPVPLLPPEQDEKQRQAIILQQLQQQILIQQQVLQQQQLFTIQQQQQGASPAVLALAAQQLAEQQKQHQQLVAKFMQLTLISQQTGHPSPPPQPQQLPHLPPQHQNKEFSAGPSALEFLPSHMLRPQPAQPPPPATAPFEMPLAHQETRQPSAAQQPPLSSGLSLGPSLGSGGSKDGEGFDAIKSLLSQLQESTNSSKKELHQSPTPTFFSGSGHPELPPQQVPKSSQVGFQDEQPPPHRSIWDLPVAPVREDLRGSPEVKAQEVGWGKEESPVDHFAQQHELHHRYEREQQQVQNQQQHEEAVNGTDEVSEDVEAGSEDFVPAKANEKRDKKLKRAEEKRRQKEARRAAEAAQADYIPGAPRQVVEHTRLQHVEPEVHDDSQAQIEALQKLQEDHRKQLEREAVAKQQQQQQQQQQQVKLAPWAKKVHHDSGNKNLSLSEIQRLEEEREREAKLRRDQEEQELRARQEAEAEQMRRQMSRNLNWATAATANGGKSGSTATKSLAEIQAEEERKERERQEQERKERQARQREMGLAQACVWGNATANLTWASRTSASNPASIPSAVAPSSSSKAQKQQEQVQPGFWDDPAPQPKPAQAKTQQQKSNSKNKKIAKEEAKVAEIFREKARPKNEFEAWCSSALEKLNAPVDIPTFMAFLNDIESPFEVQDYVRNYIGEEKSHKNFAKDYLEKRSQWKNSLKAKRDFDDDLLKPAQAINPESNELTSSGTGAAGQKTGKSKKKGNKGKSMTHLLAFSVASDRVNAGELDLPK